MMNFKLKPTDRTPYTTTEPNSPIQIQQWAEKVTSSCLIWLNYEECTRTRFKYLLKFELFQPHALLGVCEGGRQGRKELVFSLQPHHILFAGFKGMLYPEKKAYVIENCWDFSEPEERKPWKPFKWEGLPLSSQLTWNHYSPGHFDSSIRNKDTATKIPSTSNLLALHQKTKAQEALAARLQNPFPSQISCSMVTSASEQRPA